MEKAILWGFTRGELYGLLAGAALLISAFPTWFVSREVQEQDSTWGSYGPAPTEELTYYSLFEVAEFQAFILLIIGAAAIALALFIKSDRTHNDTPLFRAGLAGAGLLALVITLSNIASPPDIGALGIFSRPLEISITPPWMAPAIAFFASAALLGASYQLNLESKSRQAGETAGT